MTELAELGSYFSSNPTGPEYVSRLSELLELAGFKKTGESDKGIFYSKENPLSLPGIDGRYLLPAEITGDMLDTPVYICAQICPDGSVGVLRVTLGMMFSAQAGKTIKLEESADISKEILHGLDAFGSATVKTPYLEITTSKVPEIKGQEAVIYLLDLARQRNFFKDFSY
jgi:hypothetical protein